MSEDGQTIFSGGSIWDNTIKVWDLATGQLKSTLTGHNGSESVAISPDGQTIVSGSAPSTIKVGDLATSQLKSILTGHNDSVSSVAISPDGQTIVSGSAPSTIKVWDLVTGQLKDTLPSNNYSITSVAISSDGRTILTFPRFRYAKTGGFLVQRPDLTTQDCSNVALNP
ncbi:MAG: hypothetical protein GDA44_03840, partial [Prochloron sp. SP5CPC1]|nr:hypothetical protein [Candidatus Paraprochloron terpiosi SP5CPC1]